MGNAEHWDSLFCQKAHETSRNAMLIMVCLYDPILLQMSKKIEELENSALAEKPWQLSGEVTAQARPENSLLEEDVEFEQMSRTGMSPDSIL